ncbi:hypothetical protein [Terriglobus saanensis]|uniref:Uncharacterized protein n=1 Tax=Terriglobus saanensis (strain ATCC BAA-1853 / DSM 23119 / SP1PR4) TaxID=401053 RepID=E8V091_TERSS|nr:hypothetical protein [Terriglobus saanensis]ADV83309.1 hypothetical protein AciPR4_2530 [Terriglobus saanensis SP1PR4]
MSKNPWVGSWTYRSLLNDPDGSVDFDKLEFGEGTIVIHDDNASELLTGTIGGPGWSLTLHGSRAYGSPSQVRFEGKGLVGGELWIYDYIGWLVPVWPNSTEQLQRTAFVGSVVRTIPHSNGNGGTAPAGVVASFYAVKVD